MKFIYAAGATPLDPDEADGLLLPLTTQEELNSAEYKSILTCRSGYLSKRISLPDFLTISEQLRLHRDMFCEVWSWAGSFRKTEKSLGVAPHQIQLQLQLLLENILYRCTTQPMLDGMALLAEFHHRLVSIHPFVNGNGRHARLATDKLAVLLKMSIPSWGPDRELTVNSDTREAYIKALREADRGTYRTLVSLMSKEKVK